jgi:hypothetical protein
MALAPVENRFAAMELDKTLCNSNLAREAANRTFQALRFTVSIRKIEPSYHDYSKSAVIKIGPKRFITAPGRFAQI